MSELTGKNQCKEDANVALCIANTIYAELAKSGGEYILHLLLFVDSVPFGEWLPGSKLMLELVLYLGSNTKIHKVYKLPLLA